VKGIFASIGLGQVEAEGSVDPCEVDREYSRLIAIAG
jgi:hypothetical protein